MSLDNWVMLCSSVCVCVGRGVKQALHTSFQLFFTKIKIQIIFPLSYLQILNVLEFSLSRKVKITKRKGTTALITCSFEFTGRTRKDTADTSKQAVLDFL